VTAPSPDPDVDPADGWLTVDDLARLSGIPSRTIRFYRESKLLAPGTRVGRRSLYPPGELDRLRVIADLREQGLGLEAIARLLDDPEGKHLAALAAAGAELRRPWTDDRSATMTRLEVIETLGVERSESIDNLVKYGVIVPVGAAGGPSVYQVPSVALLQIVGDLKHAGLDARFMYAAWLAMQRHLSALAAELLDLYVAEGIEGPPDAVVETFALVRPVALRAVQQVFATAAEHTLAAFVETGGTVAAPSVPAVAEVTGGSLTEG
jgi:DNA-binding transcriptional MerR regulator